MSESEQNQIEENVMLILSRVAEVFASRKRFAETRRLSHVQNAHDRQTLAAHPRNHHSGANGTPLLSAAKEEGTLPLMLPSLARRGWPYVSPAISSRG
ncbi:hypothetical protein [Bradyrhizobium sp. LTSP885]|uniref:hypothetical protein n=1 Tax=Bradyrhizobium sp. LTSP885 TaxID=1619232 RepID=UPI0012DFFD80|nr:hypothetical protein [Bradyrhizobium sp. LTSP885]